MFEKQEEKSAMSCEAADLVRIAAAPGDRGSIKAQISAAANKLKWKFSRTREIWYGRARRIDAHEMDALRSLAQQQAERYARVAEAMRAVDPKMYERDIIALVGAARRLGGQNQP